MQFPKNLLNLEIYFLHKFIHICDIIYENSMIKHREKRQAIIFKLNAN